VMDDNDRTVALFFVTVGTRLLVVHRHVCYLWIPPTVVGYCLALKMIIVADDCS